MVKNLSSVSSHIKVNGHFSKTELSNLKCAACFLEKKKKKKKKKKKNKQIYLKRIGCPGT